MNHCIGIRFDQLIREGVGRIKQSWRGSGM